MPVRTYHDPLHLGISLESERPEESMVMDLIDSSPFQRLRRIRQLGPASFTFHGAESSRFTHSIGVFHIARRAINKLIKCDPQLKQYRGLLYASALLHDIGHGPLSHTSEEMFGINHEKWSALIVRDHSEVKGILNSYGITSPKEVADLLEKNISPRKVIKTLVSSQLDCDRIDYLLRDSYSTGTNYGQIDLERILSALTLAPDGDLAIQPKGVMAIEHYLVVRNLMYRSVYNHRLNEVCNWILERIVRTVRQLGPSNVWADECMKEWLWSTKDMSIKSFLDNDDNRINYHLMNWKESNHKDLSELCNRLINRVLLQAIDISYLNNEKQLEALAIAMNIAKKNKIDPENCCGLRHQKHYGYYPYRGGLRLWDGIKLNALEQVSPLVKGLITPVNSALLIHPKEIHEVLSDEIKRLCIIS